MKHPNAQDFHSRVCYCFYDYLGLSFLSLQEIQASKFVHYVSIALINSPKSLLQAKVGASLQRNFSLLTSASRGQLSSALVEINAIET